MNADSLRQYYDYHFAMNRFIWQRFIVPLSQEQFEQPVEYSVGSVRNHIVHLINVDYSWFHDLQGQIPPDWRDPEELSDREEIRAWWDEVIAFQKAYLANLTDEMVVSQPIQGEDAFMFVWQVLLHVANHGTDHRAQVLRAIHDMGYETMPQDYVFYLYDVQEK